MKLERAARTHIDDELAKINARSPEALSVTTLLLHSRITSGPWLRRLMSYELSALTPVEIEKLKLEMFAAGRGREHVSSHMKVLSAICESAWGRGDIDINPVELWRNRRNKRRTKAGVIAQGIKEIAVIPDRASVKALLDAIPKREWQVHGAVLLGVGSGLRLGEIRGLRWGHIAIPSNPPEDRILSISESWPLFGGPGEPTKTGRARRVLYPAEFARWWARNRQRGTAEDLVLDATGYETIKNGLFRASARAGLATRATFQVLRHTFASHLLTAGYPLEFVSEQLGNTPEVARKHYAAFLKPWERPRAVPPDCNPTDLLFMDDTEAS